MWRACGAASALALGMIWILDSVIGFWERVGVGGGSRVLRPFGR